MDTRDLPLSAQGAGARTRRSAVRLLREAMALDEPPLELLAMVSGATGSMWGQQQAANFQTPPLVPVMVPPAVLPQLQRFMRGGMQTAERDAAERDEAPEPASAPQPAPAAWPHASAQPATASWPHLPRIGAAPAPSWPHLPRIGAAPAQPPFSVWVAPAEQQEWASAEERAADQQQEPAAAQRPKRKWRGGWQAWANREKRANTARRCHWCHKLGVV